VRQPIRISLDTEIPGGAGYIRYGHGHAVRQEKLDEHFCVAVDFDADGNVVGVELTSLDAYAFGLLADAGRKYDLAIPDLTGSVATS